VEDRSFPEVGREDFRMKFRRVSDVRLLAQFVEEETLGETRCQRLDGGGVDACVFTLLALRAAWLF